MTNEVKENELVGVKEQTSEVVVARSNERFDVIKTEEGKFVRKAKYEEYSSVVAETKADKIWLFNLLEGGEEGTNGLKDHIGKVFDIANVILRPYDKVNENTGELEYGVLTYILLEDKTPYVTSSKSVYFTMKNIFKVFGDPTQPDFEPVKVQVIKKKGLQHEYIDLKVVL